jgi:hypothetical protein
MDILRSLDQADWIDVYEIQEYKRWSGGLYRKIKIVFADQSVLFAREYVDEADRHYSFHRQTKEDAMIARWDNAPHHKNITTFPHHKHLDSEEITASDAISLKEIIEIIGKAAFRK